MNIYEKLQTARIKLNQQGIKKTGENKFQKYFYYELEDFIAPAMVIFQELKLCSFISYTENRGAKLTLVNSEVPEEKIIIESSPASCDLKGMHDIQNLGSVETYHRRYLYLTLLEITESDMIDSSDKITEEEKKKAEPKKEAPPIFPKPEDLLYVTELQMKDLLMLEDTKRLQDGYNALKELGASFMKEQNARIKTRKEQLIKEGK